MIFTLADGPDVIGAFGIPVYWSVHIGRKDLFEMFQGLGESVDPLMFSKIQEVKTNGLTETTHEHFIIHHHPSGSYTIEDRNLTPMTYLNNRLVSGSQPLMNGDVIAIPLFKNNQDSSCFIQIQIEPTKTSTTPIKQLMQCSTNGKFFITYWEEDPTSRRHFATKFQGDDVPSNLPELKGAYKSLRPSSHIICPHCGNPHSVLCPQCHLFICYDGKADKIKCKSCGKKYKLAEMQGSNIDIRTV